MFFKKQVVDGIPKRGPETDVGWDDKTVKQIADSNQLNVRLTHMSHTISLGQMRAGGDAGHKDPEWSIRGVMTHPKFITVDIGFNNQSDDEFGGFAYDRQDNQCFNGRKVNLAFLRIWLSDRDGQTGQLFYSTLRDAIMCGRQYTDVRFWKEKGKGLMTQLGKQHGYSYEGGYQISGLVIWPTLQARRLPKWTVPTDQNDFSLDALPKYLSDIETLLD